MFWKIDPPAPVASVAPASAGRSEDESDSTMAVAVLGDSTRVDRLIDCSKLPDSVTGVMLIPGMGETETLMLWETFRFAWLVLSPSTDHPIVPDRSTWTVIGDGGGGGGGAGVTMTMPFMNLNPES